MRILFITETAPYPLDTGGRIKSWHTLEALSTVHETHCHTFIRRAEQREPAAAALGRVCASVTLNLAPRSLPREGVHAMRSVLRWLPFTVARHYSPNAMRRIVSACRDNRIEAVYCDHLSTLEYGRRLNLPIIHDAHNVEHLIVERYAATMTRRALTQRLLRREAGLLRDYERARYRECAMILAVSEVDAAAIASLAPGVPVIPVPIGVQASALVPVEAITEAPEVIFVGTLDWPPNREAIDYFARIIWPLVLQQVPEARLTVVGRGETGTSAYRSGHPSVRFTGWVPDVTPYFQQSRMMVVPLRSGSGMRVKILDAFARGIPVVTTSIGIEGIFATDGEHALIADTPERFASETVRLLRDRALAERLSRAARDLARTHYDVGVVGAQVLEAVNTVFPPTSPSFEAQPIAALAGRQV